MAMREQQLSGLYNRGYRNVWRITWPYIGTMYLVFGVKNTAVVEGKRLGKAMNLGTPSITRTYIAEGVRTGAGVSPAPVKALLGLYNRGLKKSWKITWPYRAATYLYFGSKTEAMAEGKRLGKLMSIKYPPNLYPLSISKG